MKPKKRILVSPLNWGLGHASRCIPVIRELLNQDAEVFIAAEKPAIDLLQIEFPELNFISLPPFQLSYSNQLPMPIVIGLQLPSLLKSISRDYKILAQLMEKHRLQGVISDNRYGMHSKRIPSAIITHQIHIKSPVFQKSLRKKIGQLIDQFDCCWVPDYTGSNNLSGNLSHGLSTLNNKLQYIAPLSRFEPPDQSESPKIKRPLMVILSGPEPNRSNLESEILDQLKHYNIETLFLRGLPGENRSQLFTPTQVELHNHLPTDLMRQEMLRSEVILCRSGYSSIMDLIVLEKKALLIPTKGQSEQEYLAEHLLEKKWFYSTPESRLNLISDLKEAIKYTVPKFAETQENLTLAVKQFMQKCA